MQVMTISGMFHNGAPFFTMIEASEFSFERLNTIVSGSTSDGAALDPASIEVNEITIEG